MKKSKSIENIKFYDNLLYLENIIDKSLTFVKKKKKPRKT